MSEEEIIRNVERIIEYKVISNYINNNDSRAIQGLLDLYNKEKEKNNLISANEVKLTKENTKLRYELHNSISKDKLRDIILSSDEHIAIEKIKAMLF